MTLREAIILEASKFDLEKINNLAQYRKRKQNLKTKQNSKKKQETIKFYQNNFEFLRFLSKINSFSKFKQLILSNKLIVKNWLVDAQNELLDILSLYEEVDFEKAENWSPKTIINKWFSLVKVNWNEVESIADLPDDLGVKDMLMAYFDKFESGDPDFIYWSLKDLIDGLDEDDDLDDEDKEKLFAYFKTTNK